MVREWTLQQAVFYREVWYLGEVQRYEQGGSLEEAKSSFGVTGQEQWDKVHAARQDLRDRLQAIGERVNSELSA